MFDTEDPGKPNRVTFTSRRALQRRVDRCKSHAEPPRYDVTPPPRYDVTPNAWLASSLHR
jgi:hypothetical protein